MSAKFAAFTQNSKNKEDLFAFFLSRVSAFAYPPGKQIDITRCGIQYGTPDNGTV